jgi:hypothetical protein
VAGGDAERLTAPDYLPERMRTGAAMSTTGLPRTDVPMAERPWLELTVMPERTDQLPA